MGVIATRLAAEIARQQDEIARIQTDAQANLQTARQRLQQLQQAQTLITPQIETALVALVKLGFPIGD